MNNIKDAVTEVKSVTSYLQVIFKQSHTTSLLCYRGQSDVAWELRPAIMRGFKADAEHKMFSELTLDAPGAFGGDKLMFDKLVRAQHYGLPTRLLDVTLNPLVGLYFACRDELNFEKDGVINIFEFNDSRVKFADSDTVSLICNLSRLSDAERVGIVNVYRKRYQKGNFNKTQFRELPEIKRLTQFVRVEKSYFLDMVNPSDLFTYFFVHPSKNNARLLAQAGAFVAAGLLNFSKPNSSNGFQLRAIVVPRQKKLGILRDLDALNINARSMFPEIESASGYIRSKWRNL